MKILQIHKYFSYQKGGGSVAAFFETKKLLESKGHDVIIFSMKDESNEKSGCEKYFIDNFDINEAGNIWEKIKLIPKVINNREAEKKIEELIKAERPDVAHVHNIYHYITPSIFKVLKKHNVPIVFKLSDYKVICPNYKLFNKGEICERCRGGKYYKCFLGRCLKNSKAASLVAMLEAYFHKIKGSYDYIDYFLAPSKFMRDMCVSFGISESRIILLRNVLNFENIEPEFQKDKYFSYVGRLSEEKGLDALVKAIKIIKDENKLNNFELRIAGDGPEKDKLVKMAKELGVKKNVRFLGFLKRDSYAWKEIMQKSSFTVLPSKWYDNSPIAISESMAFGTPVVVSGRGGTKEMISEKCGLVFEAGDEKDLAEKIKFMLENDTRSMRESAVARVSKINSAENYYKNLMLAYEKAISKYK